MKNVILILVGVTIFLNLVSIGGHVARFEKAKKQFTADGCPCDELNYYAQKYHLSESQREEFKLIGNCPE